MRQPRAIELLHCESNLLAKILRIKRKLIFDFWRRLIFPDMLHDEDVVEKGMWSGYTDPRCPCLEQVSVLSLAPGKNDLTSLTLGIEESGIGAEIFIHAIEICSLETINFHHHGPPLCGSGEEICLFANGNWRLQFNKMPLTRQLEEVTMSKLIKYVIACIETFSGNFRHIPAAGAKYIYLTLTLQTMQIHQQLTQVLKSTTFEEWHTGTPAAFLTTIFVLLDGNHHEWQIGFYDPLTELTASFLIGEEVTLVPAQVTFKEPQQEVLKLEVDSVRVDLPEALRMAEQHQQAHFPREFPKKIIAILQNLSMGLVYNVTYVTSSFATLNIKIDAHSGEIKNAQLIPIISFR